MAELTRHEQQAIADLAHNAGYLKLLDILAEQEAHILEEAEFEADPAKLLRTMRFWQFACRFNKLLRTAPDTIGNELKRLQEDGQFDPEMPYSRDDAWARRFANVHAAEAYTGREQDETDDPASI